jgi:hypothetical protein
VEALTMGIVIISSPGSSRRAGRGWTPAGMALGSQSGHNMRSSLSHHISDQNERTWGARAMTVRIISSLLGSTQACRQRLAAAGDLQGKCLLAWHRQADWVAAALQHGQQAAVPKHSKSNVQLHTIPLHNSCVAGQQQQIDFAAAHHTPARHLCSWASNARTSRRSRPRQHCTMASRPSSPTYVWASRRLRRPGQVYVMRVTAAHVTSTCGAQQHMFALVRIIQLELPISAPAMRSDAAVWVACWGGVDRSPVYADAAPRGTQLSWHWLHGRLPRRQQAAGRRLAER